MKVPPRATAVLIGDSVTRYINPKRLTPRSERCFKLCVPGMTVDDLHAWLEAQPVSSNISNVIIHVGVNSCRAGPIPKEMWVVIIASCKYVFPKAVVTLSSVLPAKGRHHFNNSIIPSNNNLRSACNETDAMLIDNSPVFASNKSLYTDNIHPNARGTAKLAANIKTVWYAKDTSGNRNSQQSYLLNNHDNVPNTAYRMKRLNDSEYQNIANASEPVKNPYPPPPASTFHYPPLSHPSRNWESVPFQSAGSNLHRHTTQKVSSHPFPVPSSSLPHRIPSNADPFANVQSSKYISPAFTSSCAYPVTTQNSDPQECFPSAASNFVPSLSQQSSHGQHFNTVQRNSNQFHPYAEPLLTLASQLLSQHISSSPYVFR